MKSERQVGSFKWPRLLKSVPEMGFSYSIQVVGDLC